MSKEERVVTNEERRKKQPREVTKDRRRQTETERQREPLDCQRTAAAAIVGSVGAVS